MSRKTMNTRASRRLSGNRAMRSIAQRKRAVKTMKNPRAGTSHRVFVTNFGMRENTTETAVAKRSFRENSRAVRNATNTEIVATRRERAKVAISIEIPAAEANPAVSKKDPDGYDNGYKPKALRG